MPSQGQPLLSAGECCGVGTLYWRRNDGRIGANGGSRSDDCDPRLATVAALTPPDSPLGAQIDPTETSIAVPKTESSCQKPAGEQRKC